MSRSFAVLALLAVLAPSPGRAAIPVAMYPFRVPGMSADRRADLHGVLQSALASAARRGVLAPRSPLMLPVTCGDVPAAPCLAAASRQGLVLAGRGELKGSIVVVTAALYDRNGARTRELRFVVDLVIENLRPVNDALMQLELEIDPDGTIAGSSKTPIAAPRPAPAPAPGAAPAPAPPHGLAKGPALAAAPATAPAPAPTAKTPALAAAAPAAKGARAPVDVSAPASPALWKRQAGPLFTILGGALLAGGATVAVLNKSLADDLSKKRTAGTLTTADRASYDKVDRNNVLSTALLAAGGVSAAAGTWFWITAPARPGGGAVAMAGGRF